MPTATSYDVYLSDTNSYSGMVLIDSTTGLRSYDNETPGVTFYYAVKAKNAAGASGFSNIAAGMQWQRQPAGAVKLTPTPTPTVPSGG